MRPSPDGPDRKYFSLSDAGRERFREFLGPVAGASHKSRTYQEGWRRMVESYTEKCQMELIHLNKEDQVYVKKMVAYIGAKSYFYDDEALGEQLYNMVCDLKVAEKEGIRAVDYFGKDPRAMVDQVLSDLPKRSLGSYVGLVFLLGGILVGMRYLMDFTWMTPLKIGTFNLCCHSTQFLGVQPVHHVALVQTELW